MTNLIIQVKPLYLYDSVTVQPIVILTMTAEQAGQENNGFVYATTATANLSDSTYPRYADYKTAAVSSQAVTMCNGIVASVNADDSASYFTTFSLEYVDSTTQDSINASISTALSAFIPTPVAKSFATPTRTAGTAFQISTTRDASVVYSIPITSNATLVAGSQSSATLQYADNSAMTTNLVTLPGDAFGVASGLLVSGIGSLKLLGLIPAGKWVKITMSNLAGTPTLGAIVAQEVLI